jgi:hypothetical protein
MKEYVMKPCKVVVKEPPELMKQSYIKMHGFSKEQVEKMKMVIFENGFKTMWNDDLIDNFLLAPIGDKDEAKLHRDAESDSFDEVGNSVWNEEISGTTISLAHP